MINEIGVVRMDSNETFCKGLVYRLSINQFINKRGQIIYKETMTPLKRESCPGCEQCGWLKDALKEQIAIEDAVSFDDMEHNAKYYLTTTNESRDWETGIIDDYDLIFKRL